jgi:DNA-binding CsgD family transcriptional regulator
MDDLITVMGFVRECLVAATEADLNRVMHQFGQFLGFEFTHFQFKECGFAHDGRTFAVDISMPDGFRADWIKRGITSPDPLRTAVERRILGGDEVGSVVWGDYDFDVGQNGREIRQLRDEYGLHHGFSVFCNAERQGTWVVLSFGSTTAVPDDRVQFLSRLLVPHLARARKRLGLALRLASLTKQEKAVADWLVEGKTNWEIAQIMGVSERTVKFHVTNILGKLEARNRQYAIALLIAERFMN